jgi:CBS domain-containing protein
MTEGRKGAQSMGVDTGTSGAGLAGAARAFLRRHPPFDAMEEEALTFLSERLALGYYPRGASILSPDDGEPRFLYVIRNGRVELASVEAGDLAVLPVTALGPGECFSVGALLERRATGSHYAAAADTFCYQLNAADFAALLERSARFREFSTRYLASLLRESRRLLRMHHASLTTEQQAMNRTLRSLVQRAPVTCPPDCTLDTALRAMHEERVGSIVITAEDGAPAGILTRHDVLGRIALPRLDLGKPISAVMTPAPRTLPAEATAYDAALLIAQHGARHVPVVDGGRLIGVITERDLFALQRVGMRGINRTISTARGIGELQQAASDIRALARSLIGQGVAAEPLTLIISELNDALTRRIIELEQANHALDGITWGWLAFGSEGRYEQTISTDQDNGLIFADVGDQSADGVRERLLPLALSVNRAVDACGYPLCKGDIMAGNPQWCLNLNEWMARFAGWIADTDPQTLLNAAIFFDFRAIHGREELAAALREKLLALTAGTPRFLKQLAEQALAVRPPLGVLTDFVTGDLLDAPGMLDLKKSGARLFVDAARVLALGAGVAHTSTAQRLRQAGPRIGMSADEVGAAVEGFQFVQMLRLRSQFDPQDGPVAPNRVRPDALNEVDRRMLKESLRQARKLQRRLALDYGLLSGWTGCGPVARRSRRGSKRRWLPIER